MSEKHQAGYMPWDRTGNRLLLQSGLGKSKPSTFDLPDQQFVYGKLTPDDPEKVNSIIYNWQDHQKSINQHEQAHKDLIATNKKALSQLHHTSSQFSSFRKTNTLFKPVKEGTNVIKIHLPEQSHAYGKPLDLQDPIKLLLANNYGQRDKLVRHSFYHTQSMAKANLLTSQRKLSCHITKNHQLVKESTARRLQKFNWQNKEELWKLSKFTEKAVAKVQPNRRKTDPQAQPDGSSGKSEKRGNSYQASSISEPSKQGEPNC